MLVVPLGLTGMPLPRPGCATCSDACLNSNDVYFKVGMLTIIGLAAKNAILIVEFAVSEQRAGRPPRHRQSSTPRACACGRS